MSLFHLHCFTRFISGYRGPFHIFEDFVMFPVACCCCCCFSYPLLLFFGVFRLMLLHCIISEFTPFSIRSYTLCPPFRRLLPSALHSGSFPVSSLCSLISGHLKIMINILVNIYKLPLCNPFSLLVYSPSRFSTLCPSRPSDRTPTLLYSVPVPSMSCSLLLRMPYYFN